MAGNKYTGEVPIKIGSKNCTLVYDWRAISAMKSKFSKDQIQALIDLTPDELAELLVIGLQKKNPDITVDFIMESSPDIATVAKAIDTALLVAYYGPEHAEKVLAEMAKIEEAMLKGASPKKKSTK